MKKIITNKRGFMSFNEFVGAMCFHKFVDGYGGMGDALTCMYCGFSKYPEVLPHYEIYKRLGRIIKNDGGWKQIIKNGECVGLKRKEPEVVISD